MSEHEQTERSDAASAESAGIAAVLERIDARLERLETAMVEMSDAGRATFATAVDGFDERVQRLAGRGVDVEERLRLALQLVERLSEPRTLAAVQGAAELLTTMPDTLATGADTLDGLIGRLAASGVDVDERLRIVAQVAERLTAPETLAVVRELFDHVGALQRLLDSGIFAPGAVDVVDRAACALAAIDLAGAKPVGIFGALRAMRDPSVQRSLGTLVEFGRLFGRSSAAQHDGDRCQPK